MMIRDATIGDLPAIFEIYNEQVLHGTATFDTVPKDPERDARWLTGRNLAAHPVIVGVVGGNSGGEIVGWASLSAWSDRCAYARAAEESVYIHKDHRGRGYGRTLLRAIIERGRAAGLGVLLARIAGENPGSVRLHEELGFARIGTMRRVGEKFGRILDVEMMDLHLDA
ncbi:MAG: N-acetyltransferase family protein [Phycisphaerales bacterium]|nr:MAG: N-acetyltransferase family protein [Phycisphaerales bacterium]